MIGNEEPSHYNTLLEKIHCNSKQICSITDDNGTIANDLESIERYFTFYYQNLLNKEETDDEIEEQYLNYIIVSSFCVRLERVHQTLHRTVNDTCVNVHALCPV